MAKRVTPKCQCTELIYVLRKTQSGEELDNCGVRCGFCVEGIMESKNALVRENQSLREELKRGR